MNSQAEYAVYSSGSPNGVFPADRTASEGGSDPQRLIAVFLWGPGILIAIALFALGQQLLSFTILGGVLLVHTLINPVVATYFLILSIPMELMISVIPGVTTVPKILALLVVAASAGPLARAVTGGRWDPAGKWILLLVGWAGITILWAEYTEIALLAWQTLVLVWTIPLLISVRITDRRRWRMAVLMFIMGSLASCMVFIMSGQSIESIVRGEARGKAANLVGQETGTDIDANGPARLAAIGVIGCLMFFFTTRGVLRRALAIGAIGLLALSILLFMSRNVYLGLPFSLLAGMLMLRGAGLVKRFLIVLGIVFVGGIVMIVFIKLGLLGHGIQERFDSIFTEGTSAGHRTQMWQAHIHFFLDTGMRGLGIGQVSYTRESLYHVAHNDFIDIAGNLGLPALIGFVGFHVCMFRRLRRIQDLWVGLFCVMGWLMCVFGGLTQTDYSGKYYTLVMALIIAGMRVDERERAMEWSTSAPVGFPAGGY